MDAPELRLAGGPLWVAPVPLDVEVVYDSITDGWFLPQAMGGGEIERADAAEAAPGDAWFRDDAYAREIIAVLERTAPAAVARRRRAA